MTPIESLNDVRMATLVGLAINLCESLALANNQEPDTVLAEHLYLAQKYVGNVGTDVYVSKLIGHYPLLEETIK